MTERKDRIEHTLEVLVYAPIGVGLYLKDMGPTFVNMFVARGRAEIDRRQAQVQQRTTTARSIGQVAVAFGVPMVRQRVEREVGTRARTRAVVARHRSADPTTPTAPARAAPEPARRARRARADAPPSARTGAAPAPPDTNGSHADPDAPDPGLRRAVGVAGRRAARRPLAPTSSTPCAPTRRRTASAARSSARSTRSPRRRFVEDARVAPDADLARVAELARELRTELRERTRRRALGDARGAARAARRRARRAQPARRRASVVVGTTEDVVVGYGIARCEPLRDGTRLGVIDEIYVEPEARAVGVGELDRRAARRVLHRCGLHRRRRDRAARRTARPRTSSSAPASPPARW